MPWLYRYETKGIQSWILDSNLMRDLAGGSALVEGLTREAERRASGATIVQATSGAMTAVFPDTPSLEAFASEWPMAMSLCAPGLQLVQAWVKESAGLPELFEQLAIRRNMVPVGDVEAGPWVLRAGRSGLPAIPTPADIQSQARRTALDVAAVAKERAHQRALREARSEGSPVTGGLPWGRFLDMDLWPEGPVAVIHADGSGVGKLLMKLGSDYERLKRFSAALREATTGATRAAVEAMPGGEKIHARPVVSAGDDLTYIVPAASARAFAATWLAALEKETEARKGDLGGSKIVGGAGIAIVHRRYPFSRAYKMADQLCKAAKDKIKDLGRQCSVLTFRRVTTSLADDIARKGIAWVADPESRVARLDSLVDAVRDLPRGTLRHWLTHHERGEQARAKRLWSRAAEVADAQAWHRFQEALAGVGADPSSGAFKKGAAGVAIPLNGEATPIRDALTLRHVERREERE